MTRTMQITRAEADQLIADEFGVNADYVSELLTQFDLTPNSFVPEWRECFEELTGRTDQVAEGRDGNPPPGPAQVRAGGDSTSALLEPSYNWSIPTRKADESERAGMEGRRSGADAQSTLSAVPAAERIARPEEAAAKPEIAAPVPQPPATPASQPQPTQPAAAEPAESVDRIAIRGPGLKLAENMAASISVPTATSQRQISVKLLEENRRLINARLKAAGQRVSFT